MIYVLASSQAEAVQWAGFRGLEAVDFVWVRSPAMLNGRTLIDTDAVVRLARFHEHAFWPEIDMAIAEALAQSRMTETLHGRLVRQGG